MFLFSSESTHDSVAYNPVKTRLLGLEAEVEEPTTHKAQNQALWLVYSFASATNVNDVVFTRS